MILVEFNSRQFIVQCSKACPPAKHTQYGLSYGLLRPSDLDRVIANDPVIGVPCRHCGEIAINEATLHQLGRLHDAGGPEAVIKFLQQNGG